MTGRSMETLHRALERLAQAGFEAGFRAQPGGLLEAVRGELLNPEDLVVEEIVRFEGESDPEDAAVLFALRSADGGVRGTFVSTYGTNLDPDAVAVIERLAQQPRRG